jgi:hypothetical protein
MISLFLIECFIRIPKRREMHFAHLELPSLNLFGYEVIESAKSCHERQLYEQAGLYSLMYHLMQSGLYPIPHPTMLLQSYCKVLPPIDYAQMVGRLLPPDSAAWEENLSGLELNRGIIQTKKVIFPRSIWLITGQSCSRLVPDCLERLCANISTQTNCCAHPFDISMFLFFKTMLDQAGQKWVQEQSWCLAGNRVRQRDITWALGADYFPSNGKLALGLYTLPMHQRADSIFPIALY